MNHEIRDHARCDARRERRHALELHELRLARHGEQEADYWVEPLDVADRERDAGGLGSVHQVLRLRFGPREGLLDHERHAALDERKANRVVLLGGHREHRDFDVDSLVDGRDGCGADRSGESRGSLGVGVDDVREVDVGHSAEDSDVVAAHHASPDDCCAKHEPTPLFRVGCLFRVPHGIYWCRGSAGAVREVT